MGQQQTRWVSSLLLCAVPRVLAGCVPAVEVPPPRVVKPASDPSIRRPVPLPAGTLAREDGKQGRIEVAERGGRRLLLIGDVVQGAVRLPLSANVRGPLGVSDPMVALIKAGMADATTRRALKLPAQPTALCIGLGTGQTAAAMRRAGLAVEVAELEPKVIQLARRFFGYRGHAVASDGLAFVDNQRAAGRTYDVILVDAFSGTAAPEHLVTRAALNRMRAALRPMGVLAVRLLQSPGDKQVGQIAGHLDRQAPTFLFGSGVGQETQNLYFLSGGLRFQKVQGIAAWPVRLGGRSYLHAALNKPLVPVLDRRAPPIQPRGR